MKFRFSLKWKLIIWLTAIGFITSIAINYSFVYFGYSKINHTMKQLPIINWHNQVILEPLKMLIPNNIPLRDNQKIRSFLQSLTKIKAHKVFHDDELFTNVSISAFVVVDLDSKLLIQTSSSSLLEGDISNQIPI
ncbi:MAG: hypothetical protein L3J46_10640, partial [Kangiellaceae bacterium]|nr:hypothetical protein [Kangiellaceae bacterium]